MTSEIKVNQIKKASGTTITIGESGDTIALASGASQTGFGRSGSVDWQTTKKTSTFTAVSGEGYFVDTSGGAVTMNLPSSPSAGNIVAVKDYSGTFGSNNLTIGRGGSPINGGAANDAVINTQGASIVLIYVDGTQGWVATQDDSSTFTGASYITATGGTITNCGNDRIHTFTSPGTFTVCSASCSSTNNIVSYMVIAGGGGGGSVAPANIGAGGGGAGGYREVYNPINSHTASPLDGYSTPGNRITVSATAYPIVVGAGGAGGPGTCRGANGSVSSFSTISSAGGGYGGGGSVPSPTPNRFGGGPGGSGGGMSFEPGSVGAGNTPPVSPPQGNNGGTAKEQTPQGTAPYKGAAAGGGAGGVGEPGQGGGPGPGTFNGGVGGAGVTSEINGTPTVRASGGSGGSYQNPSASPAATPGGGGGGGPGSGGNGSNGTANTGGGGGGAGTGNPGPGGTGGTGGSGLVIIRYKYQ